MALIQLSPDYTPITAHKLTTTIISCDKFNTIKNTPVTLKKSAGSQNRVLSYFFNASMRWRTLPLYNQTRWIDFANAYPLPYWNYPGQHVYGAQLYIKRNTHQQLFNSSGIQFLDDPNFVGVEYDPFTVNVYLSAGLLYLDLVFSSSDESLDCLISLSRQLSPGISYLKFKSRNIIKPSNLTQTIDITSAYRKIFGTLPTPGVLLSFSIIQMGKLNGQYYYGYDLPLIVS